MKKLIALTCAAAMMLSTSFAQTFSDLPETHWAQKVVEEMVGQKIISGYTDGTFRPSKNISKIESLILLARIAGINNYADAANKYLADYENTLSKYTTQYKKDVAYLLGTKVLETSDLDTLLAADQVNAPITREEMAVLITKIMGKNDEVKSKSLIILSFSDKDSITPSARPYVHYVSSEKIMSGVDTQNFSPKTHVTRAQAACILQRIYKKVNIKPDVSTSTDTSTNTTPNTSTDTFASTTPSTQISGNLTVLNGEITKVDTTLQTVFIKDTSGKTDEYEYDAATEIYVNSVKKNSAEIKKGLSITATVKDNTYITLMRITKDTTETVNGTISSFDTSKKTITVSKKTYSYTNSTTFFLNDKSSTALKSLKKNYEITLTIEDDIVTKVETKEVKKEETFTGKITKVNEAKGYIVIQDSDGEKYILRDDCIDEYEEDDEDFYFDDDIDYYYNGSAEEYDDVATDEYIYKKGNYVRITADTKGTISKFEIASKESKLDEEDDDKKSTDKIIGEIIEADEDDGYIIIETEDGDEYILMDDYLEEYDEDDEDFYFDKDTKFSYNAVSKTYSAASTDDYLYNDGLFARITLDDDDYIEKIELAAKKSAFTSSSSSTSNSTNIEDGYVFGYIVDMDSDEIVIEDDDGEEYEFEVSEDAIIIERSSDAPEEDIYYYDEEYEDILSEDDDVIVFVYKEKSSKYYTSLIILMD